MSSDPSNTPMGPIRGPWQAAVPKGEVGGRHFAALASSHQLREEGLWGSSEGFGASGLLLGL